MELTGCVGADLGNTGGKLRRQLRPRTVEVTPISYAGRRAGSYAKSYANPSCDRYWRLCGGIFPVRAGLPTGIRVWAPFSANVWSICPTTKNALREALCRATLPSPWRAWDALDQPRSEVLGDPCHGPCHRLCSIGLVLSPVSMKGLPSPRFEDGAYQVVLDYAASVRGDTEESALAASAVGSGRSRGAGSRAASRTEGSHQR